ncbi:DUF5777 family beta-barrel protein [Phaeocystidibacter luteus]|uniref:DUF5777 domain-containing protein n=1 Tax=Phaeocystidibacter luteus TaxID=911197 RepID=A0A6N6RER0_9FLAO|nr:DUF5777 family beta-barrel protein [Phaeocystidibacter luteus]KAB2807298.1 hypothetical protein F8C67_12015 [Phaeocystidibacter luteus]
MKTTTYKHLLLLFIFGVVGSMTYAQDDLLAELDEGEEQTVYTSATFKGSRIINLQSTELPAEGVGQFIILHRFGSLTEDPLYDLFGLDVASVRLSFDYSIKDYLNVGVGRSSGTKVYDGWVKARLYRQSSGAVNMPVSILYYGSLNVNTTRFPDDGLEHKFGERLSYVNQIIVGRKFSESFSMELVPTVVHFNTRQTREQPNTIFGLGVGGRIKLTNRVAITADYMLQAPRNTRLVDGVETAYNNSFSIGVDIETGGHVFQLHLTNSQSISDPYWMTQTPGNWFEGDIFFGFNISRVFTLKKPKRIESPAW